MGSDRWVFDGIWWRLDRRTWSILVRGDRPLEDDVTDAEVHLGGRRYGATFATPEALRRWLDSRDGDDPGEPFLWISDLVLLPCLSLAQIVRAVEDLLLDGRFWSALDLFDDEQGLPEPGG